MKTEHSKESKHFDFIKHLIYPVIITRNCNVFTQHLRNLFFNKTKHSFRSRYSYFTRNQIKINLLKSRLIDGRAESSMQFSTSNGVKGHFPSTRFAPGLITRPLFLNFPLQLLSRAISISCFSSSPPSYSQQENATISLREKETDTQK